MSARDVARAIDACRRGWPVAIAGAHGTMTLLPIETADADRLKAFSTGPCDVLLSRERAATLALANQRDGVGAAVRIAAAPWLDLDVATALSDPARDLSTPLKGPFLTRPTGDAAAAAAALKLARLAGLLPAFFVRDEEGGSAEASADATSIDAYDAPDALRMASRARLPTKASEACEIVAFRSAAEAVEHVALVIGAPNGRPPLVRLHSECLTGDVFGSLKCDCGPQLARALELITSEGWGMVLYLRQEGRGIGLVNKLRAYALQDQGFDTIDANTRLGFQADARDFGNAAQMLRLLGQEDIRLLTNNPEKVAGLEAAGIGIAERVAHALPPNPHNHDYLAAKRDRAGHML